MDMIPPLAHWPRDRDERHPAEIALLDQWPDDRLGPELAAIAQAAQGAYREVLALRIIRDTAKGIRDGARDVSEWPAAYGLPYDRTEDYDRLCELREQRHEGIRRALLAALRVRPDGPEDQAELILLFVALSRDPAASPNFP
ncbi:hypothetical protein [Streptomyces sp. NPDC052693]|uniref:hypothetical protein n=1 Tax=Streptomyces sp. NPDC052693 TaxID=3155814 RepID=UPI0034455C23